VPASAPSVLLQSSLLDRRVNTLINAFNVQIRQPANKKGQIHWATFKDSRIQLTQRFAVQIQNDPTIGCPTSSVAQANLTIKINFNLLRSFSSSDIFTIYLHAFLQSLYLFEKNCVQSLPRDFRQNDPNTNKKFTWSFSAISHQLSFDIAKKQKSEGAKSDE
jgi:hypothetical protein